MRNFKVEKKAHEDVNNIFLNLCFHIQLHEAIFGFLYEKKILLLLRK